VTKTAGISTWKNARRRSRAASSVRVAMNVISVSPNTQRRPDGTRATCPARANPGDVMPESSVVRSSGTPSFMTSRPSDSRLASRISRTVIRPVETADVRAVTVRSVPHDPVLEGRRLVFEMALALLPEHPSDPVHNLVDRGTELVRLPVADDRPGPIGMYDDL